MCTNLGAKNLQQPQHKLKYNSTPHPPPKKNTTHTHTHTHTYTHTHAHAHTFKDKGRPKKRHRETDKITKTGRQSTRHHEMHTQEHALKKRDSHLRLFSGRREPPLLVIFDM